MRTLARYGLAALAALALAGASFAQGYPTKPVRLIVPFPPGGGTDNLGRLVAQKLGEALGQQVTVENRPGAGTIIGTEAAAKAPPDGYTLLMAQTATGINPSIYPKLPYDTLRDFVPVVLVATAPTLLVVNPQVPAKNLQELLALAHAKPGTLNFPSGGNGTSPHMAGEFFKSLTGAKLVHVPYKGGGPAITDLLGGQVQLMFDTMPSIMPHVKAGKLRPIALAAPARSPELPEVPTFAESGLAAFEADAWYGIFAPAGTPREIVDRINAEVNKILSAPDVRERMKGLGADPVGKSPEFFGEFVRAEIAKWAKVVKEAGIKLE
jgi:tripartite-type tricarboxylate transporter receptor subunit TctC